MGVPSAPPPRPLSYPHPHPPPQALQPRVHGQGRGPRGRGRRGRNPKWRFRASPGLCSRPSARPPRRPLVDAPGGGARLWGKVWGLFLASRSCWGRGRRGGGAGPPSASSGLGTTTLRVTAPSALGLPAGRPGAREGGADAGGTLSLPGDLVRSHFPSRPPPSGANPQAPPRLPSTAAVFGSKRILLCFYDFPPTNHLSDQFYLLPSSLLPTLPSSPSETPFSEVRHFTNHICCFSNCDFFFKRPPPPPWLLF